MGYDFNAFGKSDRLGDFDDDDDVEDMDQEQQPSCGRLLPDSLLPKAVCPKEWAQPKPTLEYNRELDAELKRRAREADLARTRRDKSQLTLADAELWSALNEFMKRKDITHYEMMDAGMLKVRISARYGQTSMNAEKTFGTYVRKFLAETKARK